MSRIFVVNTTNAWHNPSSRDMIGLCTTFDNCMKVIRADIRKYKKEKLSDKEKEFLLNYRQTQGRNENYEILELDKNVLLE